VLSVAEAQVIVDACPRLGDRFLFALLRDRLPDRGGAGLRHEDIAAAERKSALCPR